MNRPSLRDRLRGMNQRSLFGPGRDRSGLTADQPASDGNAIAPIAQARAEAIQRVQVGLFGIGAMVLLVGLASIIGGQAELNEDLAVPEAAPTTEPNPVPAQANPLADAGVVPDIAAEPSASPMPALPPAASGNVAPGQ
jgi:hypothetical protein